MSAKHRVLIAVSGMSPQIITETLYALAVNVTPWIPDEIYIVTTKDGAVKAEMALLRDGRLKALCQDYQFKLPVFDQSHIVVIKDKQGVELNDIRCQQDNEAAADCMTQLLQKFTDDPDTELHVSMAGGRKTMGFHLGYALSMLGRPKDRLSHVLVSENFESLPTFYYPTPQSSILQASGNRLLDARDAQVTLAEIPYIRLRTHLKEDILPPDMGYSDLVRHIDRSLKLGTERLRFTDQGVFVGDRPVPLNASYQAFYRWLAWRCRQSKPPVSFCRGEPNTQWAEECLYHYDQVKGGEADGDERLKKTFTQDKGMTPEYFQEKMSRIKKILEKTLGKGVAVSYLITNLGKRNDAAYGLVLAQKSIVFENGQ
ncbi:MAG: TIGR02584 family CRISPR-associated protein [Pseudomonadales bacterium]|nr:TIGR02584 family CRISPR-associated protein [Pseudomonadales bacterium]